MIVQHNMSSMNANRNLGITAGALQKSTEKLSSGYRINRAGDDAAGLAISEKMRGQIRGLDKASSNSEDAISLIQTAEGSLQESQNILQRMRELAVQAASDTETDSDRKQIQNEIDQLTQEVDRIANTSEFNTKKLLNGDVKGATQFYNGSSTIEGTFANGDITVSNATNAANVGVDEVIRVKITALDSTGALSGATISVTTAHGTIGSDKVAVTAGKIMVSAATFSEKVSVADTAAAVSQATFAIANADGKIKVGDVITITLTKGEKSKAAETGKDSLRFQIGSNAGQEVTMGIDSMKASDLGVANAGVSLDVTSQDKASVAINAYDQGIQKVSSARAKLGAMQNRLEHTIANLDNSAENLQAAESGIRDVDMATEMTNYSKQNILMQAGQSMLAQANQSTQGVLSLLQ